MKFVLFVEGHTEKKAVRLFLKRWLDLQLSAKVGIQTVRFAGWSGMIKDSPKKARMYLSGPDADEVIGVIGLLDLCGPDIYPSGKTTAKERLEWATQYIHSKVAEERFRIFFAVHEIEAWLLSDPTIFPSPIRSAFPSRLGNPEEINFDKTPYRFLNEIYQRHTGRKYKKVVDGIELFRRLNPEIAYNKCAQLKRMLDEMLRMAKDAGL